MFTFADRSNNLVNCRQPLYWLLLSRNWELILVNNLWFSEWFGHLKSGISLVNDLIYDSLGIYFCSSWLNIHFCRISQLCTLFSSFFMAYQSWHWNGALNSSNIPHIPWYINYWENPCSPSSRRLGSYPYACSPTIWRDLPIAFNLYLFSICFSFLNISFSVLFFDLYGIMVGS